MAKSGMMEFAERYANAKVEAAQRLMIQYMMDTLQITIHQTEGWGYDRILRLCEAWRDTRVEYSAVMLPGRADSDVMQEHMDRVIRQIMREKADQIMPFSQRYPELKEIRYRKG